MEIINGIKDLMYSVMYKGFSSICVLIDFIKNIFLMLCGIEEVDINGEKTDLLNNLLQSVEIKKVFLTITIIGFILLVIFTCISTIKTNYQEKQNLKTVLMKSFHALIIIFIIPITIMSGILLANSVMGAINQSMQNSLQSGNGLIGGHFLVTIGSEAYIGDESLREEIESRFISGILDYSSLDDVKKYYKITSLNYVIGIVGSTVILVMFVLSALTFVRRIFDVVLLYIVSPISISTIPLDEGNRFRVWKEMLISKILSAYGVILVMNLFFLIIPKVYEINFFDNNFYNGIVYILFLIGGSFAVSKASKVVAQLCGSEPQGGELAQMFYNIRSGIALSKGTTALVKGITSGVVGGSEYKKSRHMGHGRIESIKNSLNTRDTQRKVFEGIKTNKYRQILASPVRLATMPFGMVHDLAKGGILRVGKNFIPRLNNVILGDTFLNKADVKVRLNSHNGNNINSRKKSEKNNGITDIKPYKNKACVQDRNFRLSNNKFNTLDKKVKDEKIDNNYLKSDRNGEKNILKEEESENNT